MKAQNEFDVIVIGGGHAGTEAALASARLKAKTLLLTHNIETIGQMSCNPAIGGIGKGHLVKEVDALGGIMARAIDRAGIHFRTLNSSKGVAVRATRAQADRVLYRQAIRQACETQENLFIFQQPADDLLIDGETVTGVITQTGIQFKARAIILTAGTFLSGKIHIGLHHYQAGRAGDPPANTLAQKLRTLPLKTSRLKTGTPPRIDGRSVNFSVMEKQEGELPPPFFSFLHEDAFIRPQQVSCYITHTNPHTHELIIKHLSQSPLFTGAIEGTGPRYCPSIEDKVVRFADKTSHQIFVEPEGLTTHELYPNGISTSLPFAAQEAFIRSIKGFEQAHITRPGYAIEYDFFDPRGLKPSLETKTIAGLFFAGQINGTTGYEEAAAQGIMAGINAARFIQEKEPFILCRDEAYIGVLIDDLITRGTEEPYRMFTSRAEYRLLLREDNADARLTSKAYALGLISDARYRRFTEKEERIQNETKRLQSLHIHPHSEEAQQLASLLPQPLTRDYPLLELLRRPEITYKTLSKIETLGPFLEDFEAALQVEVQAKYAGYIERQAEEIKKQARLESQSIPKTFDFHQVRGLSTEVKQKLSHTRPATIGMASRIPGVTPAAISLLLVHLKKRDLQNENPCAS